MLLLGKYAMSNGVTTGDGNIAIGENTLPALDSGACNIALGCKSSYAITSGTNNISLGRQSLFVNSQELTMLLLDIRQDTIIIVVIMFS